MLAIAFCLSSAGVMYSHRISPRADQGMKRPEEQSQKRKKLEISINKHPC